MMWLISSVASCRLAWDPNSNSKCKMHYKMRRSHFNVFIRLFRFGHWWHAWHCFCAVTNCHKDTKTWVKLFEQDHEADGRFWCVILVSVLSVKLNHYCTMYYCSLIYEPCLHKRGLASSSQLPRHEPLCFSQDLSSLSGCLSISVG